MGKYLESISSWIKRAKCKSSVGIDFFSKDNHEVAEAKKYCTGCPVRDLCNTYAIAHNERGVWGATSYRQRSEMDEFVVNAIRQMYYQEGLLEYRTGDVGEFLEQQGEQLPEHIYPTAV